ncbi:MAG TPA: TonB-dependent receptor [Bacteroidota bacterium]|nr:TonB-dependent receptor [Bacteroidota bacterium]
MKWNSLLILLFINCSVLWGQQYRGEIVGSVIDSKTQELLPSVNVQVMELPSFGASTDSSGHFDIKNIPVGTYSLRATIIGYDGSITTNVVVSTGRSTKVSMKLSEQAVQTSGTTVQATYFNRETEIAPLSVNNYDRAEVKRQPGSVQDVQRVVQNLPGIASSNDNVNELIVRGGAPYENLTVMDYMEIPSINHYPNDFNSAGPISMINIDLVDDVQFSAGGFPVQYGDKMSSVMDIKIREGDREKSFASNSGFNMAGLSTLMEGKLNDGKGSWIFSARESLLEIVDKLIGMSAISLTAVPKYWDTQAKVVYDLSSSTKLSLSGLYGDSRIYIAGDPKESNSQKAGITDSSSIEDINDHSKQYVLGVNLKQLWGKDGYSVLTLYTVGVQNNVDVQNDFTRRVYDNAGNVVDYSTLNTLPEFNSHEDDALYALKYDMFYKILPQHEISLGGQIQTTNHWTGATTFAGTLTRYDLNHDGIYETQTRTPDGNIYNDLSFGDATKFSAYLSDHYSIFPLLSLTLGGRYDYFTYSHQGQFSPRGCISYDIFPPTTTISLSAGEYWQTQPLPYYADDRSIGYNRNLANAKSDHVVLGLQHIMDEGIKLSLEAYYKKFSNLSVSEQFIYSAIDTFWSDKNLAIGKKTSYGIEFFLQKKQVTNYYGTVSISLSQTMETDPRIPPLVGTYRSQYDYPVIVNLVGGKIAKGARSWLNDQTFFIKYPSYILPISDEMEISFRYRYQTGGPYTPNIFVTNEQTWEGNIKWSKGVWIASNDINSARYPDYSRLDLQWISRFYMQHWNINAYIALMNVLNRKNVFYYEYRSDGTKETVYQFAFFPVGGIEIEF